MQLFSVGFQAMGTSCELHLHSKSLDFAREAAERAISDIRRIELRYSRYLTDSVIALINRVGRDGGAVEVDEETACLLDYADTCYRESDGLFDITSGALRKAWNFQSGKLPGEQTINALLVSIGWGKVCWDKPRLEFSCAGMELDFGGICKEYAADRAATICLERGVMHGLVNLGGDIRAIGPHPDGTPWRIGVRHPQKANGLITTVLLAQGGLASSGDYERCIEINGRRYSHILNPMTGWPVQGLAAASVIAPHCLIAGSASTIAMLKESAGAKWLKELGLPHMWVDGQGRLGGSIISQFPAS
jgi:thiamine biosynthesis lipoprotein